MDDCTKLISNLREIEANVLKTNRTEVTSIKILAPFQRLKTKMTISRMPTSIEVKSSYAA